MPLSFQKFVSIYFLIFHFILHAQIDENHPPLSKNIDTEFKEKENIDKAFYLFNHNRENEAYAIAHKILKRQSDFRSKANANILLAHYFNSKQLIDSSLFYNERALQQGLKIKNDSLKNKILSTVYNLLATNNKTKGLWEESKKWHLKGIDISRKLKDKRLYFTHLHGLALVYSNVGDYKKALKLFKKCLSYRKNPEITYGSYINTGNIYSVLKDYDSSNVYFEKALKLSIKNKDYYAISVLKINMAANYQDQKKYDKALSLYNEAVQLTDDKEYKQLSLIAHLEIGNIYMNLNKYEDAKLIYSSCLHSAIELGYLNEQKTIYDRLKNIFIAQNNYKLAFQFLNKFYTIKDSIYKLQKDKEINELEVKYKTLQKEKEIKLLQIENYNRALELKNQTEIIKNLELKQEIERKENENKILSFQRASEKKLNEIALLKKDQEIKNAKIAREKTIKNIILYSFLIFLVPIIALLVIYYQKLQTQSELNKKQEEINKQKVSALIKTQELKVIKAFVKGQEKERKRIAQELHDSIGGNLAAIKLKFNNIINNNQTEHLKTINEQIDDTYEQVRNLSHNLISKKLNENNFCRILEEYINSIWGNNSSVTIYPRTKIDRLDENIKVEVFKIIQELTTNTIKHAQAKTIDLQINLVENELNILFEDNGVGFNPKQYKAGVGHRNIQTRLKNLQGAFYIDSRINRGTIINIQIPIS